MLALLQERRGYEELGKKEKGISTTEAYLTEAAQRQPRSGERFRLIAKRSWLVPSSHRATPSSSFSVKPFCCQLIAKIHRFFVVYACTFSII